MGIQYTQIGLGIWGTTPMWSSNPGGPYIQAWVNFNSATFESGSGTISISGSPIVTDLVLPGSTVLLSGNLTIYGNIDTGGGSVAFTSLTAYNDNFLSSTIGFGSINMLGASWPNVVLQSSSGQLTGNGISGQILLSGNTSIIPSSTGEGLSCNILNLGSSTQYTVNWTANNVATYLASITSWTLNNTPLILTLGYSPVPGDSATIINGGAGSGTGIFNGIPEGGTITVSGKIFYVTYVGGPGKNVIIKYPPVNNIYVNSDWF